jgi:hypothetical protein
MVFFTGGTARRSGAGAVGVVSVVAVGVVSVVVAAVGVAGFSQPASVVDSTSTAREATRIDIPRPSPSAVPGCKPR